jgi:hypothetical protein
MEGMLLFTFQQQVHIQCQFIIFADAQVKEGLRLRDVQLTFYALQNLLNAAANISKALWGQGGKYSKERQPLRASINITDGSPLKQTAMRNNFEHFDERMEEWWRISKTHHYIDLNIFPRDSVAGVSHKLDWFRNFDPQTGVLTFWSQDFNVRELVNEAHRIVERLEGKV